MKYRADIDGLRGIAVLAVMFYHAFFFFSGGFFGVDIFFVISGYLISGLIYKQLSSNLFTFTEFYLRRMRRLLSTLYTVLFFILIASYILFLQEEWINVLKSVFSSMLFSTNLYFSTKSGYFDLDSCSLQKYLRYLSL